MEGAIFGEVRMMGMLLECDFFVATAIFGGKFWDIAGARSVVFPTKNCFQVVGKGNLSELTGCGCQFHGRISLGPRTMVGSCSLGRAQILTMYPLFQEVSQKSRRISITANFGFVLLVCFTQ